jgi:hypothetical protein
MQCNNLLHIQYPSSAITQKRTAIRKTFISRSANISDGIIDCIASYDLELLFQLYDVYFLEEYFQKSFPGRLRFSLSTRMTRAAGKTNYPRNLKALPAEQREYEIRMGINFFFNYNQLHREKKVNGINTKDALEALQLVFEHEIIHLLELHCYGGSNCHKARFKGLAENIFGHTDSYHHLPTEKEIASTKFGFHAGDRVCFIYEGEEYRGFIHQINKRATVMVPDEAGLFLDQRGKRHSKWYIPIPLLKKN